MIGITCGDPSGIGPEIVVKALKRLSLKERESLLLFGEESSLRLSGWNASLCPLIPVSVSNFKLLKSKNNPFSGLISFKAFAIGVKLALKGKLGGLVTAPISKKAWLSAGLPYKGHTEYLREICETEPLMSFHRGKINSALITEHISITSLPGKLTRGLIISKASIFRAALSRLGFGKNPIILVSGLNPHCGEDGELGKEEQKIIKPALRILSRKGFRVYGPFNPDSIFESYKKNRASGALFMYHDQLLPVIKYLDEKNPVVHVTWGLPFLRTSPAHGTAFDIAWKNKADPEGMLAAVKMALKIPDR